MGLARLKEIQFNTIPNVVLLISVFLGGILQGAFVSRGSLIVIYASMVQGVMISRMFTRINSSLENFTLLSFPFFILAGTIMGKGKITEHIINFSQVMVGHVKESLGHVVILSATLFSVLTGLPLPQLLLLVTCLFLK